MKQISTPRIGISLRRCFIALSTIILIFISKSSTAYAEPVFGLKYTGMSSGKIPPMGTLPVVLTPLKGYYSNGVSHLFWSSLQESNSSHFDIERSNDGINYAKVGKVIAKSSSDREVNYMFDDIRANGGMNYYRLKLSDKDGQFQYSNIEVLNVNIKGIFVTGIYPAPFTDKVNVTVSSEVTTPVNINLFDNTGKLLINQQTVLNKGITNLILDNLNALLSGFYIIKVQVGETIITKKLFK